MILKSRMSIIIIFANWNFIKFYEHCFSNCEHWKFKWSKIIKLFQIFFVQFVEFLID